MNDFENIETDIETRYAVEPVQVEVIEEKAAKKVDSLKENGIYIHEFKTPFKCEEKIYDKIIFDFARLTGKDMLSIETEMNNKGEFVVFTEFSRSYLCNMCARASKVGADVLEAMSIRDFNKIMGEARNFLLGTGY